MAFWTDNFYEPKFSDRFVAELKIDEDYIVKWYNVKSVSLPTFKVGIDTYTLLNREIKFPQNIKWNPITITITETIDNNLLAYLRYHYEGLEGDKGHFLYKHDYTLDSTISKERAFNNNLIITQYSADGEELESWEITNCHITDLSFAQASYDDTNIRTTTLTLEYEWAYLGLKNDGAQAPPPPPTGTVEIPEEEITIRKKEQLPEQKPKQIPPPPIDLKNPPKTRKEVQKVEQDLQKYMGTNAPNREKLKFPERRPIKPVDRMVEKKKQDKKRGSLTPAGRRFIAGGSDT